MTLRQKFYLPGQSKSPTSLLMPWTHVRACSSVCMSVTLILHLAAISGIAFCILANLSDVPVDCAKQLAERRKKPSFIFYCTAQYRKLTVSFCQRCDARLCNCR